MSTKFNIKTIKPQNGFKYKVRTKKKSHRGARGFLFLIFIAFVLFLFTYVLPSVTIIIMPVTQSLEKEFAVQLTADESDVNLDKNIFVAQIVAADQKIAGNFKATGEKDAGDQASGQAVFYNQTGRSQPLTTNIDLINDQGIIFVIKENMTIPGARVDGQGNVVAGELTTEIQAKEPGEQGNVGPGRINISALDLEKQAKIYGQITEDGLSGGNSEMVRVVSQEDLDNAKDELIKELEPKIKEKLEKRGRADMYVSDKLINYDDSEISKEVEVESEVEDFEMSLNLKAKALVYNHKDLRLHLREQILAELPVGQTIAETEFGNLEIEVENFDIDLGLADLKIKATFPVAEQIDLDEVKRNILGKKEQEARRYILSLANVKDVRFMYSLSLIDKIPDRQNRVRVKLGEIK